MAENVIPINGGPTGLPEPNANCIRALEEWLAMARAGEIVGVSLVGLTFSGGGCWAVAGKVGGFSMLGALEIIRAELVAVERGECSDDD